MNDVTIVTALFDIGRGNLEGDFKRDFNLYKEWFSKLLEVNMPMVIFCESSLVEWILDQRNEDNTQICVRHINHFKHVPYYSKIQNIRTDPKWVEQTYWLKDAPQAALELYNPLVMSKYYMLDYAAEMDAFSTKYFLWIDAGVAHTTDMSLFLPPFEEKITPHLDKLLFLAFPYRGSEVHGFNIEALDGYASEFLGMSIDVIWNVRAMLFGGPKYMIKESTPAYTAWLYRTLGDGYMGTEENILTLLTYTIPEMINLRWIENGFIANFLRKIYE